MGPHLLKCSRITTPTNTCKCNSRVVVLQVVERIALVSQLFQTIKEIALAAKCRTKEVIVCEEDREGIDYPTISARWS